MVNTRGNTYSKNHTSFDTCSKCPDFWSFGFHEGATKDFPAIIDYVLETTGEESLFYVGHSMGTTQYLVSLNCTLAHAFYCLREVLLLILRRGLNILTVFPFKKSILQNHVEQPVDFVPVLSNPDE